MIDANYLARAKDAYEEQRRDCDVHMRISPTRFSAFLIIGLALIPAAIYYAVSEIIGLLSSRL